ncbi:methyltransferase domain-containing protein [Polynucleobacter sp. 73C-SIWE]|uniref:class I SAM-dependent methyltransferase n=1 Tax=Polynucleobacter sp. 73C-SIWE TaxID=2689098 RepID=UPI001C0E00D7|nr:class I SAM-dependent methyltransferase [Polynucleobacter sp. 73C-SIWE]MBU3580227.1 methyltransferase domain-containing protein [Polynucleobacter sp. 73C-SIWE]
MASYPLTRCLCCDSNNLSLVLDLAMQSLANSYSEKKDALMEKYPLALNVCPSCWHAQLSYCVDRGLIFDSYKYISGTSKTLNNYFRWFAKEIKGLIPQDGKILEIAANDGSLIAEMNALGLNTIGIDPAKNIVNLASDRGLNIKYGYWPQDSNKIQGKFDAIICMNVLAHVDNPKDFLLECKNKLSQNGVILIQPSQARMFGNYEFDTCYHEHISFFNTSSIKTLASRIGLKLLKTSLVNIHGDSPIYMLVHNESERQISNGAFSSLPFGISESLEKYEIEINLFEKFTYDAFSNKATSILKKLDFDINQFKSRGFDIIFVGAAAKAMTVINAIEIVPDYFLDESPLKIGLYPAGIATKIENFELCKKLNKPALFVITAWNFRNEISEKIREIGIPKGSVIYTYFPESSTICEQ